MIRPVPPASSGTVCMTIRTVCLTIPVVFHRCSYGYGSSSVIVNGSLKTNWAISKVIPCFCTFWLSLSLSHVHCNEFSLCQDSGKLAFKRQSVSAWGPNVTRQGLLRLPYQVHDSADEAVHHRTVPCDFFVFHEVPVKIGVKLVATEKLVADGGSSYSSASRSTAATRALYLPWRQFLFMAMAVMAWEAAPHSFSEPCRASLASRIPGPSAPESPGRCGRVPLLSLP